MPPVEAAFADKLQWLAIEHPYTLDRLHDLCEVVLRLYRQPKIQEPGMCVELSRDYEFRTINVTDPEIRLAPDATIGRNARDVVPAPLFYRFDRAVRNAARTGTETSYIQPSEHGPIRYRINVCPDAILVKAFRALSVMATIAAF